MEKYENFKNKLEKSIRDNKISLDNEECYLIKGNWEKELTDNIGKIHKSCEGIKKGIYTRSISDFLPKNDPVFVNNMFTANSFLNINNKLKLIKKELMEEFYNNKNYLTKNSTVKYFSGNNSLIIEFTNKDNNKIEEIFYSLLIINPLESNNRKSIIIFFKVKDEDKKTMYKELLSQKYNLPNSNKIITPEMLLNSESLPSFYKKFNILDVKNQEDKKKEKKKLESTNKKDEEKIKNSNKLTEYENKTKDAKEENDRIKNENKKLNNKNENNYKIKETNKKNQEELKNKLDNENQKSKSKN